MEVKKYAEMVKWYFGFSWKWARLILHLMEVWWAFETDKCSDGSSVSQSRSKEPLMEMVRAFLRIGHWVY